MRECGECFVCCVYPRISSIEKPAMTHCKHLKLPAEEIKDQVFYSGNGCNNCTIYDNQPTQCKDYQCAWLQGYGRLEDRPDKSLMLFDNSKGIENALEAKPLKPNQENTRRGIAAINAMSSSTNVPVIVLNFYERKIQRLVGSGL